MTSSIPSKVKLVDVGPRDGLQNEKSPVPAEVKIGLVHRLQDAGLKEIEVTSYVSPKWVPQMADNHEVMQGLSRQSGVRYSVLTPNLKGYEAAVLDKPDEIVVFGSASRRSARRTSTAPSPRASSASPPWSRPRARPASMCAAP